MRKAPERSKKRIAREELLAYATLLFLVVIGTWLRVWGIIDGSFSFTYDVGRDMLAISDIVVNHKLTLLGPTTGLQGLFYGPWWYYLLSIPFAITSGDPKGVALFMAALGVANIVLAFLIGKKLGSVFFAITTAAFISVTPFFLHASSQIWSPNVIPTLMLFLVLCLLQVLKGKNIPLRWAIVLGILLALIIEMEIIFGLIFSFSFVLWFLSFFRKKITIVGFLSFVGGILFIELPRVLFEIRHSFLMSKSVLGLSSGSAGYISHDISARANFIEIQSAFDKLWSDTVAGGNHEISLLLLAVFLIIFFVHHRKTQAHEKLILAKTFITSGIVIGVFIFFSEGLWLHYMVGLPVLFVLSVGIGFQLLKRHISLKYAPYMLLFALVWLNLNPISLFIETKKPMWEGNEGVYRNQIAVIDYIYKQAGDKEFKYVLYTPPVHDYTYRYLFSWYGAKKYNKIPRDKDAELFFLIIEPDLDYYHRRLDWLDQRKSDGKLLDKERIVGNIIVQTRILKQ